MGNVSTAFTLRDLMSGPLGKISAKLTAVDNGMNKIKNSSGLSRTATDAGRANSGMGRLKNSVNGVGTAAGAAKGKTTGLFGSMKSLIGTVGGLYAIQKAFSLIGDSVGIAMNRTQQETKLSTIYKERMGTSDFTSTANLMSKQSETGVIGSTTQMAGAQQVATFMHQKKSVESLIPAMNNLAVQQKGVNATGDDMKNIGNMVGKVMNGQTGALKRVGISFTSAQEKAIKYGAEQERAAALAKVITGNVGEMNKAMAKTPQGQMTQLKNKMAGVKLQIGKGIMPALTNMNKALGKKENLATIKKLAYVFGVAISGIVEGLTDIVMGVTKVFGWMGRLGGKAKTFKELSNTIATVTKVVVALATAWGIYKGVVSVVNTVTKVHQGLQKAYVAIDNVLFNLKMRNAAATGAETGAQIGFNAALLACPLTWIVVAIVAVVAILIVLQKKFNIFGKLWGIMKGFGKWVAGGFVGAIGKAKKKIVEFGSNAKKYFGSRLKATFDGAKKIVGGFKEHFSKKIKQAAAASKLIETKCGKSVHGAKGILGGMNKFITGVFTGNWKRAWKGVVQVFKTIWNGIKDGVKKPLNFAIDLINKFLNALNKIHVKLPKKLGGGTIGFNIPTIPKLAKGTRNFQGGGAWVGENGPEYVEMPKGSRVNTAGESRRMSGNSINVAKLADTVIVREEADINKIAYEFAKQLNEMMPDAV